jgi:hypothetical protein
MMTELQLANILQCSVVAAFWLFVAFKVFPEVRLDSFRQGMFAVRDELFDYAAEGNISFEHPAYLLLRRQMNGFIRYAHHLTVFRILMTVAINKISGAPEPTGWHLEWEKALESIKDRAVQEKLRGFYYAALKLAFKRLLIGSPLLWATTAIFVVQLSLQGATKGARQLIRAASRKAFTGPINDRTIEDVAQGALA